MDLNKAPTTQITLFSADFFLSLIPDAIYALDMSECLQGLGVYGNLSLKTCIIWGGGDKNKIIWRLRSRD